MNRPLLPYEQASFAVYVEHQLQYLLSCSVRALALDGHRDTHTHTHTHLDPRVPRLYPLSSGCAEVLCICPLHRVGGWVGVGVGMGVCVGVCVWVCVPREVISLPVSE